MKKHKLFHNYSVNTLFPNYKNVFAYTRISFNSTIKYTGNYWRKLF